MSLMNVSAMHTWATLVVCSITWMQSVLVAAVQSSDVLREDSIAVQQNQGLQLAHQYVQLIEKLDAEVPVDSDEISEWAQSRADKIKSQLARLEESMRPIGQPAEPLGRYGRRLVDRTDLVRVVSHLGEVSSRADAAERLIKYAMRAENRMLFAARSEADRRHRNAIQRAWVGFHMALAARQHAMRQLWALRTGKAIVARKDVYTGRISVATPHEALLYTSGLTSTVNSPVFLPKPVRMKAKELYTVDHLNKLKQQKPALQRLAGVLRSELKHLARGHLEQVRHVLQTGNEMDCVLAISSLGWWNGQDGRNLIDQCLVNGPRDIRLAGLSALRRWRHNRLTLLGLAHHKDVQVRILAIDLAQEQFLESSIGLEVARKLRKDPSAEVREKAATALNQP